MEEWVWLHKITQGVFVILDMFISWLYWWIHGHTRVMRRCRTGLHTQTNTGNWNIISRLFQCPYPGYDIVFHFCKMLPCAKPGKVYVVSLCGGGLVAKCVQLLQPLPGSSVHGVLQALSCFTNVGKSAMISIKNGYF